MRTISTEKTAAANSTFAIGGVSCSADGLVVAESFVHRIKFSGKNPAHRKSANRYGIVYQKPRREAEKIKYKIFRQFVINYEKNSILFISK